MKDHDQVTLAETLSLFVGVYFDIRCTSDLADLRQNWTWDHSENYEGMILAMAYEAFCEGVDPSEEDEAQAKYDQFTELTEYMNTNDLFGRTWRSLDRLLDPYLMSLEIDTPYVVFEGLENTRALRHGYFLVADAEEPIHPVSRSTNYAYGR